MSRGAEVDVDVLVVGAGPTGLALAALLSAAGVRTRVVDRLTDRGHESRALAVQARTLEVLAGLGVSDDLVAAGNPTVRLLVHAAGRTTELPLFDAGLEDTAYPYLLFVSQAETEAVLTRHLGRLGGDVERGVELVDLEQDPTGATCRLRDSAGLEEVVRAAWVVGCDGVRSTVRRRAGIAFTGAAYPQTFVLADLEADGLTRGAAHVHLSPRGPLLFFPLGRPASWRLIAMRPRDDVAPGDAGGGGPTLDDLQRLTDDHTGGTVRLHDPVWMTDFRLHHRGAERYRSGRVLLAGDAAHVHSPAGAQGMNTGIQDAVNLAWKLALVVGGRGSSDLVDTYGLERAPVGRAVLRLTDRAFTAATSSGAVVGWVRTHVAPRLLAVVRRAHRARTLAFRTVAELTVGYPRSPLSAGSAGRGRADAAGGRWAVAARRALALLAARPPRAGDRLPDAAVVVDGRRTTLHRELAEPVFHLLVWDPSGRWPARTTAAVTSRYPDLVRVLRAGPAPAPATLHDPTGRLARRLGVAPDRPAHLLVRPDGHVALRGTGDLRPLRDHLRTWLVAAPGPAGLTGWADRTG